MSSFSMVVNACFPLILNVHVNKFGKLKLLCINQLKLIYDIMTMFFLINIFHIDVLTSEDIS